MSTPVSFRIRPAGPSLSHLAAFIMLITLAWSSLAFGGEIHDAAQHGDLEKVKALLKTTPDLMSSKSAAGLTPLILASINGYQDLTQFLLANGADVNGRSNDGSTPIIYASQNGRAKIVEILVNSGADVNLRNNGNSSALGLTSFNGYTSIAQLLLEHGARVDTTDANGKTAIYYASMAGNSAIVKLLAAHGADTKQKTAKYEYMIKGVTKAVDVVNSKFTVKLIEGSVVGADKEVEFGVTNESQVFGGEPGLIGISSLKQNDVVDVAYSGKLAVNSFNFAHASGSGAFSYTARAISVHPEISGKAAGRIEQRDALGAPPAKWPSFSGEITGSHEVRVKNPNDFKVRVGLRSDGKGRDFIVAGNGTESVQVPNGHYDIYFNYSTDPDGLYQGDSFTLENHGAEITITKVVNGNYGIHKVQ